MSAGKGKLTGWCEAPLEGKLTIILLSLKTSFNGPSEGLIKSEW
jgi:hypothetical protein